MALGELRFEPGAGGRNALPERLRQLGEGEAGRLGEGRHQGRGQRGLWARLDLWWRSLQGRSLLAWIATILELALGALLLLGLFTRQAALASGGLLILFAVAMVTSLGFKPPLDYSVMSAAAAAFLLAQVGPGAWSVDALRRG